MVNDAMLRRVLDDTPIALVAVSQDGTVLYWNRSAQSTFGYAAEEARGQPLRALIGAPEGLDREAETGHELVRRCRDGALIYVRIEARDLLAEGGSPACRVLSLVDVTQARLQRDAGLVQARYGALLASMPDAIVIVNESGRIVLSNAQAETLFGYAPDSLVGAPIEILLPERYRGAHGAHRARYFAQSRTRPMGVGLVLHGLRRSGEEFPVEISLSPLPTETGSLVMSAIRDISDRRRAEQKFRALLESAPDAIVIVDRAGHIVLVNGQTERLFGYPRAELLGRTIDMLVPEQYRGAHPMHRRRYFEEHKPRPMGAGLELEGLRRDGSRFPVEISLSPLETEDGTLVSSSIRDITDRRQAEHALQEKNLELARANRAKDSFLATMSHELRTPLNAVIGFTGLLLMKLPGPLTAQQEKQLGMVQSSARHLLSLINDLLDLARIDSGNVQMQLVPMALQPLLEEVVATLRPAAEARGLQLVLQQPAEPVVLPTDRRALQQILINLINNAIKFSDRGSIGVELALSSAPGSRQVRLAVTDTGIGIAPEDQARLFQAFTQVGRASQRSEGTGLGLHLSGKLASLLGGHIDLVSEPGQGSRFTLVLDVPAAPPGGEGAAR